MDNKMLLYSSFILIGTFISSISQIMLKKSAMKQYSSKIKEYLNPLVIGAYVIFFMATICSVIAYKVVPLSFGPVLEATGYIYVAVFGAIIFKERITGKMISGLALIISGIIIYTVLG